MRRIPPSVPEASPRSIEDVLEYAELIEAFANTNSSRIQQDNLNELAAQLDVYSGRLYGASQVMLSGLHKIVEPSDDPTQAHTYLTEGFHIGDSCGFSVFDVDGWEDDLAGDSEQSRLFDELKNRLPGQFVVAHLVQKKKQIVASPDLGLINNLEFHVVAPFRTNDLLIPDLHEHDAEAEYNEARAVLAALDSRGKDQVREVINCLKREDPLEAVVRAAKPVNSFLGDYQDSIVRNALATVIGHNAPPKLFETIYQAESLPPVYYQPPGETSLDISHITLPFKQIAFDQLVILDRYFINNAGAVLAPEDSPPGLFLGATAAVTPWGNTIHFSIPVEHLKIGEGDVFPINQDK